MSGEGPLSLRAAATAHPDRVALLFDGREIRYAELAGAARRAAGLMLDHGLEPERPGARVALVARRSPAVFATLHALIDLGVPAVLLHPRWTRRERAALAQGVGALVLPDEDLPCWDAAGYAGSHPFPSEPFPREPIPDERPLAFAFTSGTSGRAKAAVLSRRAFFASAAASAENLGWREDDRWLLAMPLAHVGGLSILVRTLLAGRCTVLAGEGSFDVEDFVRHVSRDRVTLASLVPTMLARLLERDPPYRPPAHLRAVLLGGAAAPPRLLGRAADLGWPILTTYGLTEACSQVTAQRLGRVNRCELGAGPPLPGTSVRIRDGVIEVRGPALMDGYHPAGAHPSPFTGDGWLVTGDLGTLDAAGNLHVHARRTDLIVTGGENVYPAEVEQVLEGCPGVTAACVAGVEDPVWGERVAAAVVADGVAVDEADVLRYARDRLAGYKCPRLVRFVDVLPTTSSGKVDRRAVRTILASAAEA